MKIALYSHSIPPAVDGVSRRMASLLQQLTKNGHEVRKYAMKERSVRGTASGYHNSTDTATL